MIITQRYGQRTLYRLDRAAAEECFNLLERLEDKPLTLRISSIVLSAVEEAYSQGVSEVPLNI